MGSVLGVLLRNYGFTDLRAPRPAADPPTHAIAGTRARAVTMATVRPPSLPESLQRPGGWQPAVRRAGCLQPESSGPFVLAMARTLLNPCSPGSSLLCSGNRIPANHQSITHSSALSLRTGPPRPSFLRVSPSCTSPFTASPLTHQDAASDRARLVADKLANGREPREARLPAPHNRDGAAPPGFFWLSAIGELVGDKPCAIARSILVGEW